MSQDFDTDGAMFITHEGMEGHYASEPDDPNQRPTLSMLGHAMIAVRRDGVVVRLAAYGQCYQTPPEAHDLVSAVRIPVDALEAALAAAKAMREQPR